MALFAFNKQCNTNANSIDCRKKMEIKPINWSGVLLFMGPIAD